VAATTRILIIEDNPQDAEDAADAEEALEAARHYTKVIHLLLTDVIMPGASGREVLDTP
jgi:CheY-like chemotaxis protein